MPVRSVSVTFRLPLHYESMPSVEFPLSPIKSREGIVPEPIIPVSVRTPEGWKMFDFLVDSGADFSVLPRSFSKEIGVDLSECRVSTTMGVEGSGTKIYHSKIDIRIGAFMKPIHCGFASHDRIPPLLGRLDIFSNFNITFHAERNSILFQALKFIRRRG